MVGTRAMPFPPKDLPGDMGECAGLSSPEPRPLEHGLHSILASLPVCLLICMTVPLLQRYVAGSWFGEAHTSWDSGHMQLTGYSGLEIVGLGVETMSGWGCLASAEGALLSSLSVGPGALCPLPPPPG